MAGEFDLIARFLMRDEARGVERFTQLGQGDDCALVSPAAGQSLAISTDMLVAGRHFLPDTDPCGLGHKALAVNLSDLAAMGARPRAFTLALALPSADEVWLGRFCDGMYALAAAHDCRLIGGDTTAGPLNLCLTVFGEVPRAAALRRDGARPGDDVWVSGRLGEARLGLALLREEWPDACAALDARAREQAVAALERPAPRVALGLALRGLASAALDISDGLSGDLGHLCARSGLDAQLDVDALPRSAALAGLPLALQRQCTLSGGDDYELCFTAAPERREALRDLAQQLGLALTRVGTMVPPRNPARPTLSLLDGAGHPLPVAVRGFDHFDGN